MARVVFEGVDKAFRGPFGETVQAVKRLCLTVEDRELVVLAGPSGCGKSTTLRLLAGLEDVTSGAITIGDRVVNNLPPQERGVAMVFQHHALYPHRTVFENLAFPLRLRRFSTAEIERRVRSTAETLELGPLLDRFPAGLSGGQRQRVAVGRAMVRQPKVLLLDEPLSDLDASLRLRLRIELRQLHERLGATTLYVTHDQAEAMTLGQRLAVMRDGAIQQVAEPLTVYRHPANVFVAGFVGSPPMNLFRGVIETDGAELLFRHAGANVGPGTPGFAIRIPAVRRRVLTAYVDRDLVLGLRPEAIVPSGRAVLGPGAVCAGARVDWVEPTGPETHVHGRIGGEPFTARWDPDSAPNAGECLSVWLDLDRACYFDAATGDAIG